MVARDATIALGWGEIGLQSLADHAMANQDFHGGIEVSLKEAQGIKICYANGPRLFLQRDLKTGLPVGEEIAMVESHFHEKGMEFGNVGAVQTGLVMPIVETRVRAGAFPAALPLNDNVISANTRGNGGKLLGNP